MMNRIHALLLVTVLVTPVLYVPDAEACSRAKLLESQATIPSNTNAVMWHPSHVSLPDTLGPSYVRLTKNPDSTAEDVSVSVNRTPLENGNLLVSVEPEEGFEPNTEYEFAGADFCNDRGNLGGPNTYLTSFETGGPAPDFDTLGTLRTETTKKGPMSMNRVGGGRVGFEAVHQVLRLDLSDAAEAWTQSMYFWTFVKLPGDEDYGEWSFWNRLKGYPETQKVSWLNPETSAVDEPQGVEGNWLFRSCEPDKISVRPAGTWKVRMKAIRPATGDSWTTETLDVPLTCDLPEPGDTGVDGGDAGTKQDIGWSQGAGGGGCGCSTTDSSPPIGASLLFAIGFVGILRRPKLGNDRTRKF